MLLASDVEGSTCKGSNFDSCKQSYLLSTSGHCTELSAGLKGFCGEALLLLSFAALLWNQELGNCSAQSPVYSAHA